MLALIILLHNSPLADVLSHVEVLQQWVSSHGWWGVLAYILLFVITSLFLFPGSVLVIAGGVVFGVFYGTIISLFAATLASSLSFLVARYLGRAWLLHRFGGNQKFEQIERGIQRYGVDFLIFTRLIPLFPYNIQNYAYGLTAISFWRYSVVSCLTLLPGTFIFTFMASELAENGITLNVTLKLFLCGAVLFVLTQITRRVFSKRFAKK